MTDLFGNKEMKALSWKEPFATLMLHGKIETRTWPTDYRGLVLICASKAKYTVSKLEEIVDNSPLLLYSICKVLSENHYDSCGNAIAVGNLVDCRTMQPEDESACFVKYKEPWTEEKKLKDGRIKVVHKRLWCHVYENVRDIEPIPFIGQLGWKNLESEFINSIKYK